MNLIEIYRLNKFYKNYSSELKRIINWFSPRFKASAEYWVLKDVNISIKAGEAIGIVGVNGAGKSTLLKIITGTLQPSSGSISRNGKIAAILELGMGFNPNLSGRQNTYHAAGLMGYSFQEIKNVINEIEAFAEIGEYFDRPVRVYSSGMQMRVAFAVATAFRPDVLIIDEALSVGDTYFQHKSFNRIREYRKLGTTLLIVSHDGASILSLCSRAILLDDGRIKLDAEPYEVLDLYNALIAKKENNLVKQIITVKGRTQTISGTGDAKVESVKIKNLENKEVDKIKVGEKICIEVAVSVVKDISELVLGFSIKNRLGETIFGTNTFYSKQIIKEVKKGSVYHYEIVLDANLGVGSYSVSTALVNSGTHLDKNYEWKDQATIFEVFNDSKPHFVGLAWIDSDIKVKKI
jgi:lipopolysaccharide transport system ATP-binding protein